MQLIQVYLLISIVLFIFLSVFMIKGSIFTKILKIVLIILSIFGTFLFLTSIGYIVHK